MILPRTDEEFQAILVPALQTVCPLVREGVYTGDDVSCYVTFSTFRRGALFANGYPTASVWRCIVSLWVKKGVDAQPMREAMYTAIRSVGGTYPTQEIGTEDDWKQYVFDFQCGGYV